MSILIVAVVLLLVIRAVVLLWQREHGEDGHKHQWRPGTMAAGYAYRTCHVCDHREYEITG